MKSRVPINNKLKSKIREQIEKEKKNVEYESARRIFKLFCEVLNEKYGFGKNRLLSMIQEVQSLCVKSQEDEVFWSHIDKIVIDQLGVEFERENYELMDK